MKNEPAGSDAELDAALLELLTSLEKIGDTHEELYDTEVREAMSDVVFRAFIKPEPGYRAPDDFGLEGHAANQEVRDALETYASRASARATQLGWNDPRARNRAFQNESIESAGGQYFDDFFGWAEDAE